MFRLRCQECRPMRLTDIDNIAKYCIDFESVALVSYLQNKYSLDKIVWSTCVENSNKRNVYVTCLNQTYLTIQALLP